MTRRDLGNLGNRLTRMTPCTGIPPAWQSPRVPPLENSTMPADRANGRSSKITAFGGSSGSRWEKSMLATLFPCEPSTGKTALARAIPADLRRQAVEFASYWPLSAGGVTGSVVTGGRSAGGAALLALSGGALHDRLAPLVGCPPNAQGMSS